MLADVRDPLLRSREVRLRRRPRSRRRQSEDEREEQHRPGNREPAHGERNTACRVRRHIEKRKSSVRKRFTEANFD
jgi:hypothetical protein